MSKKSNLHSHTQFCDGRSTMEEMLQAARSAGFDTWGFSPHAPICLESPCNMSKEKVEEYFLEVERLKKLFPDMQILAGMEVDFLDESNGPSSQDLRNYNPDYIIGSIHFIPNQKGKYYDIDGSSERFQRYLKDYFEGDLDYVVTTYWEQTQRMIKSGGLDIVGHIDKIFLNASSVDPEIETNPKYIKMAEQTIDFAIQRGLAIEINTKHWRRFGRFFPHPRFWKRILDAGIDMPVNSDAHYAEYVDDGMEAALIELKRQKKQTLPK